MDAHRQLPLPIGPIEDRDASYGAEIDRAALPAAAKRLAWALVSHGHTQATDQGERLYAVRDGRVRDLARRLALPRSTLHRGLEALAERGLLCRVRGCLCLIATRLCYLPAGTTEVVPSAPTDDWGRITLPPTVRSPERPTSTDHAGQMVTSGVCPSLSQSVPGLSRSVPVCPGFVPGLSHPGRSSIPACAPVVVVEEIFLNNNNQPEPGAVKDLARKAWRRLHGDTRYPPAPSDRDRLLLLRLAQLALTTDLGEAWLLAAAAARPLRGDRQDPVRFFQAAAAYQAWEHAAGEPPDEPDRSAAKQRLRRALARVDLPRELLSRSNTRDRR